MESLEATLSVTYSACFTVLQVMKSWVGRGLVVLLMYFCVIIDIVTLLPL